VDAGADLMALLSCNLKLGVFMAKLALDERASAAQCLSLKFFSCLV
jgi:hypothetical protein